MPDVVDPKSHSRSLDRPRHAAAAELATHQGGPISRDQLLALGVTRHAIGHWLRSGRLHSYYRGVYLLGHEAITDKGRLMAAVLAYGGEARLSHRAAADWWGFARTSRKDVDIMVPGRSKAGQDGIDLHLVRSLDPRDVTEHESVPITTVARTLLDLAEVVRPRQLKRAVEEADRLRLFDGAAVEELLARRPGRHGLKPLRDLLSDFVFDELSREELEALFFDFCVEYGLPVPTMNVPILNYTVDASWSGTNLVVELDSRAFHLNATAFEGDRIRDADLLLAGYRVIRITYRQLTREPEQVARRLRSLLARLGRQVDAERHQDGSQGALHALPDCAAAEPAARSLGEQDETSAPGSVDNHLDGCQHDDCREHGSVPGQELRKEGDREDRGLGVGGD
jgi:predicted transcriptional regulator of viral defense system